MLNRDAKNYQIHGVSLLLSQIEVRDMADIIPVLPSLLQELEHAKRETGLDLVVLMLTDITQHNSILYFPENKIIGPRKVSLAGMTSRKKEILPWLTARFSMIER